MLRVDRIERGIVVDHIRAGNGLRIFDRLGLRDVSFPVALIMNVRSTKMGRKDMIKISDTLELDLTMLGLLEPNITVTYIDDGNVTRKEAIPLTERVEGLNECKNPRCITTYERHGISVFTLVDRDTREYECAYCGERARM